MKAIQFVGEYLLGVLIAIVSLFTIALGLVFSLFELPGYLKKMKFK